MRILTHILTVSALGYRAGGAVGGACLLKPLTSGYFFQPNPLVTMDDAAISLDPNIVVINLPDRSEFETLRANWSPGLFETPAGGSIRSKRDFTNDANSNCDAIGPAFGNNFGKVLGK